MPISIEEVAKRDTAAQDQNYLPVGPYINVSTKREHRCLSCGYEGPLVPRKYWSGRGCPKCSRKRQSARRLTYEQVSQRDSSAKAQGYKPIEPYTANHKKRLHKCNKCGHEGELAPSSYWAQGHGCPKCADKLRGEQRRLSMTVVNERDASAKAQNYKPIGPYTRADKKRLHKCCKCGYEGRLAPNLYWDGQACPQCSKLTRKTGRLSSEVVMHRDREAKHFNEFPPISKFIGVKVTRRHKCLECGEEKEITPDSFWLGTGCRSCWKRKKAELRDFNDKNPQKDLSISTEEVANRDSSAKYFDTYPPIDGEDFVNINVKRQHACKVCGHIEGMTPKRFWGDFGCPNCARRLSLEIVFDRDSKAKHFDTYPPIDKFVKTNSHRRHKCKLCGHIGKVIPNLFWLGNGCECNYKLSENEVTKRDNEAEHAKAYPPKEGQKYVNIDFKRLHQCSDSDCNYVGWLSPYNFWKKFVGCPKCGGKRGGRANSFNSDELVEKDRSAKYFKSYPPIGKYVNALTPRLHRCEIHGENATAPASFWNDGGCPDCAIIRNAQARVLTKEEVLARDTAARYFDTYPPRGEYKGALSRRLHVCQTHGENWILPSSFWVGVGCPGCTNGGYDPFSPGILYYLRITVSEEVVLYKIGITNRTVTERFTKSDLQLITIIDEWGFDNGRDAWDRERDVLNSFRKYKYLGPNVLSSGNSELFTHDVLELDV